MFKQEPNPKIVDPKDQDSGDSDDGEDIQKEVVGNWKLVDLPEIATTTGEQDETQIAKFKAKIYRFRQGQWKQRGVGQLKFLKHKVSGYIRILTRANQTHKCVMNHFVMKKDIFCNLEPLKTGNNSWTWAAYDISDETPASQKFCARLTTKQEYQRFSVEFNKASEQNDILKKSKDQTEKTEVEGENKKQQKKE